MGDRGRRQAVVAGDDDDADAGLVASGDGGGDLCAGRVGHRDQAEEAEAAFCLLADLRYGRGRLQPALGDGEDAQPLPGVAFGQLQELRAFCRAERALLSVAPDHRRAARQQRLRRALGVDPPVAVAVVDRGHELEHRIEVEVPQALAVACGGVHGHAQVACGDEHRQLGRIAGRVAARRRRVRVVARRHRVPEPAKDGCALLVGAGAFGGRVDVERLRRRPDRGDLHPVLGQGAGLVGADHVRRAERLDRAQALDHRAAAHQLADTDRERERDHRQQALRHVADEQPDREHHRVGNGEAGAEHRDRDERGTGDERDQRDQPGDPSYLRLQRALVALDALRQRGDAPELCVHAGREHQRSRRALRARRAREHQVARLEQRHLSIQQLGGAKRRHRLAAEHREVDLDAPRDESRVGRDAIALLDHQHVSRHQGGRVDLLLLSVA